MIGDLLGLERIKSISILNEQVSKSGIRTAPKAVDQIVIVKLVDSILIPMQHTLTKREHTMLT